MKVRTLALENINGYKTQTTFMQDFSIAESFGEKGVKDTYRTAFDEWKDNYIYVTELGIVLCLCSCYWYDKGNIELSQIYSEMYYEVRDYALSNLKGAELEYYFRWTD